MAEFYTVEELAEYLRLTKRTIYRLLKGGNIPAVKVGHKWRFNKEFIDEWLNPPKGGAKRRILVIDDVATSSATLDACATALLAVGSDNIYCLTVARAG